MVTTGTMSKFKADSIGVRVNRLSSCTTKNTKANPVLIPFLLDSLVQAVLMENVLATQLDYRLLSKALDVTDDTIGVSVLTQSSALVFGDAILMKTSRVFGLVSTAIATMATREESGTASPRLLLALTLCAHISSTVAF